MHYIGRTLDRARERNEMCCVSELAPGMGSTGISSAECSACARSEISTIRPWHWLEESNEIVPTTNMARRRRHPQDLERTAEGGSQSHAGISGRLHAF